MEQEHNKQQEQHDETLKQKVHTPSDSVEIDHDACDDQVLDIDEEGVVLDDDLHDELNEEEALVESLRLKLQEQEDQYLRAQAEMVNMNQRFQKERAQLQKYRSQDLAKALLPALDNLERALETEVTHEDALQLKKGVEMVLENMKQSLKEQGIEEIPALGEIFDPNYHQAVQTVPRQENQHAEEIIQVFQKGYQLEDRILRPAMVIVAQDE